MLNGYQTSPVIGDGKHNCKDQHLPRSLKPLEVSDPLVQLSSALLVADEILELELPGVVNVFDVRMTVALR